MSAMIDFPATLSKFGLAPLVRGPVSTLQINVGKRCNQACHHCHVEAGPKRTEEMTRAVAERIVTVLERSPGIEVVDLTGGAPELNGNFRFLVENSLRLGRKVIDRCNLTILFEPGMEELPRFLASHAVEIVASLPCYGPEAVDQQRGAGVFDKSIEALRTLNALGYGRRGSGLVLNLVYNPAADELPPEQAGLELAYRQELRERFAIEFSLLQTMTNMPVKRFADYLIRRGKLDAYMGLLVNHFNPATTSSLMCRSLLSVAWDGALYDCDFNQMLEIELGAGRELGVASIFDLDRVEDLDGRRIATGSHCFGCTAGAGSSCSGSLDAAVGDAPRQAGEMR